MQELPKYAELHCISNYTFLRGASHPEELVQHAAELGYEAIAITDECSLAGIVKAHVEAKNHAIKLIIGSEFYIEDNLRLILLAKNINGYAELCRFITTTRRNSQKGTYYVTRKILYASELKNCFALWFFNDRSNPLDGIFLKNIFHDHLWIGVCLSFSGQDKKILHLIEHISHYFSIPACACGNVYMHIQSRKPLQDVISAIRLNTTVAELGFKRLSNSESYLRPIPTLNGIYPEKLLRETITIADACNFSLDQIKYQYPTESIPKQYTPIKWLSRLTHQGMQARWPEGASTKIRTDISKELALIKEMQYEAYFLTVYDIVCFARSQGILCQGRGSAANSVVCYCLGITNVNPSNMDLLFERFISKERNEPPDIDVDFEHERREEVIQYIYKKYGRERAALAATVTTYRPRSAIRDVGKALGLPTDQVDRFAKSIRWWDHKKITSEYLQELGLPTNNLHLKQFLYFVNLILHFPRHLSQHVGGFIISQNDLSQLVPIENAAMPERTIIQWDKEDLEALGLLKIDVLSLGMLTAIRKALADISEYSDHALTITDIPTDDHKVYSAISKADTIGVFQIESRAQMSMLPRLRPQNYYDLVIQIAIVRPGPIQGEMVHPYLTRRKNPDKVTYPNKQVEKVLSRTLGVPIFQEQVMQLAIVAAGFTPGEADQLRRSMAAWNRKGGLDKFERKLLDGMYTRGYSKEFAHKVFKQIKGFGEYGFPESHSASFALLAYTSAWLKYYHHAAFTCALLNSQPMGFYAPAQLIQDAKKHGVKILAVDVLYSEYDCKISNPLKQEIRLGFRIIKSFKENTAHKIFIARKQDQFKNIQDLASRATLSTLELERLSAADALKSLIGHRHRAYWESMGIEQAMPLFPAPTFSEGAAMLAKPSATQEVIQDYKINGFTLGPHPVSFLRERLTEKHIQTANSLHAVPNNMIAKTAGLVIGRQRPGTASGVIFVTLEDETGHVNVIVWPGLVETQRKTLLKAKFLFVSGTVQHESNVLHLIAGRLKDYSHWLEPLQIKSRDFH